MKDDYKQLIDKIIYELQKRSVKLKEGLEDINTTGDILQNELIKCYKCQQKYTSKEKFIKDKGSTCKIFKKFGCYIFFTNPKEFDNIGVIRKNDTDIDEYLAILRDIENDIVYLGAISDNLATLKAITKRINITDIDNIKDQLKNGYFYFGKRASGLFLAMDNLKNDVIKLEPQLNNEKLPFHFNSSYKKEQLQVVFERLKEFKYLHADSDLETWLYVCAGYGNSGQIKPLNWVKDQDLLAVLVDTLFSDSNSSNLWVISKNVFTVKDKKPNINSMKNIISRIGRDCHTKTEKFINLEDLLRI